MADEIKNLLRKSFPEYETSCCLGVGGFASVIKAIHNASGREVAIKVVDKTQQCQFVDGKKILTEILMMQNSQTIDGVIRLLIGALLARDTVS